jgi:uncharacterized protein (TIGR03067 family)
MKIRLGIALFVLLGLTAFAPAPFHKPERRGQPPEITLETFQGRWRVVNMQISHSNGPPTPYPASYTHVRVLRDRWTFMVQHTEGVSQSIAIDHRNKPPFLTFYDWPKRAENVGGVALIRRQGAQVQIAYRWGGEVNRPVSFERLPQGLWIVTLQRD